VIKIANKRKPLKHIIEGDVVKVYKISKGKEHEILIDLDVWLKIESEQYSLNITPRGYVKIRKRSIKMDMPLQRFVMNVGTTTKDSEMVIDHEDRNKLNNLRSNLREITRTDNNLNRPLRKDNSTGVKGVYLDKKLERYVPMVTYRGKRHYNGSYKTIEEAATVLKEMRKNILPVEFQGID
jgi:HNH endonuclease